MQTFLPYKSYTCSAFALDKQRLRKQCVESFQILDTIINNRNSWKGHPAVKMWKASPGGLCIYTLRMCDEYENRFGKAIRSHKYTSEPVDMRRVVSDLFLSKCSNIDYPTWLSDEDLCEKVTSSHRSNLLRKDPDFYGVYGWKESPNIPYYWPV